MLLTIFLAIVFCGAITLMLLSAVTFIQNNKFFSSAPKEAQEVLIPRDQELFFGARTIGWTLMVFSILMILGVGIISIWDGFRSGFFIPAVFLAFCNDLHHIQALRYDLLRLLPALQVPFLPVLLSGGRRSI